MKTPKTSNKLDFQERRADGGAETNLVWPNFVSAISSVVTNQGAPFVSRLCRSFLLFMYSVLYVYR